MSPTISTSIVQKLQYSILSLNWNRPFRCIMFDTSIANLAPLRSTGFIYA